MKFEQHDIENSKSYLLDLIENENLNLRKDKLVLFINFIYNDIIPDLLEENLLQTLQSFSLSEIQALVERFTKENEFDNLISKSFQLEKRSRLKNDLIQLDTELQEISFDQSITKAFQIEKREKLKQNLNKLEVESRLTKGKVISMRPYLKAISIAASIILILVVWQPQHLSDKKLFADYTNSIENTSINDFTQTERIKEQVGLRGEEEHFRNYSYNETLQLLAAIDAVKQKDFKKAKEIFNNLHVEKEKNPGLALYLSISQINTDNLDGAIKNLEYLSKLHDFPNQDEAKFHLAFAYLKVGERKKAKELLHDLVISKSKFSDKAQQTIKEIRWF